MVRGAIVGVALTAVLCLAGAAVAATPPPVIGIADTGINPYHDEFSAESYPDKAVLAASANFTRPPSEWLPGYPAGAKPLPLTLGQGFRPAADDMYFLEGTLQYNQLYWVPGTKIIGLIIAPPDGRIFPDDPPILSHYGHGTGSASVAVGDTTGTCPECLLAFHQSHDTQRLTAEPWVDIASYSITNDGTMHAPDTTSPLVPITRAAARRGQVTLFAAGDGTPEANAVKGPQTNTLNSDEQGPSWIVQVGGVDKASGRALTSDQAVVKVSSYAAGNIPAASSTSETKFNSFGGTSAATPITAGVFGHVLATARHELGDDGGARPAGVVAQGTPVASSPWLSDGKLTRAELLKLVLKTAEPESTDNSDYTAPDPMEPDAPYESHANVAVEGYGVADTASAQRAIRVLDGFDPLPDRSYEDEFFTGVRDIRDAIWGSCGCDDELG